jgi:hypothetical protein
MLATGITTYLPRVRFRRQNGGTIEHAQQIANHESPRTPKSYDRTNDAIRAEAIIADGLSLDERACPRLSGHRAHPDLGGSHKVRKVRQRDRCLMSWCPGESSYPSKPSGNPY